MVHHSDVDKFLRSQGWDLCAENTWYKDGGTLHICPATLEFIDAVYAAGCAFGVGRGAYEQEQQEDAELGGVADALQEDGKCPKCKQYYTSGLLTS